MTLSTLEIGKYGAKDAGFLVSTVVSTVKVTSLEVPEVGSAVPSYGLSAGGFYGP